MANQEHLDILRQGVEAWNQWRKKYPEIKPDLSGATFSNANLQDATLYGADLRAADLSRANLQDANFTDAIIIWVTIADNDISAIRGLETVKHAGPSSIGIDTLHKSGGNIPESFLRGCGLRDWEIEAVKLYRPDLSPGRASEILYKVHELRTNPAIQFNSCFISYSSKNHSFSESLYKRLQDKGVRCWFAPEDLKIGDPFRQRIDEAIRLHDKLLLILSAESVASNWVASEVEAALEREDREKRLVLFPLRIDDAVEQSSTAWTALLRRTHHIGDFSRWKDHDSYSKAFERLLRDLKAEDKA